MANPKGTVENLQSYAPQWNFGKTKTIRVPVALAPQVLEFAHALDNGESLTQVNKQERSPQLDEAIALLTEALDLKANAGGAIKAKIREALGLMK